MCVCINPPIGCERVWTTTCYFLLATAKLYSYNYLLAAAGCCWRREMLIVALDSSSSFWLLYKIKMKKKEEEEEEFSVCPLRASWWATISPFLKDTLNIDPGLSPISRRILCGSIGIWTQFVTCTARPLALALSPEPLWLYTNRTSKQQQELSGSTWGNRRPAESVWSGETPAEKRERENNHLKSFRIMCEKHSNGTVERLQPIVVSLAQTRCSSE